MNEKSMTFEQSMTRLDEIVRLLEKGDAPLEDALKLFEEGTSLVRGCNDLLNHAELQVSKLMKGANGEPVELPFEEDA
jgi:exodeoxyribonuclease VII small subunit